MRCAADVDKPRLVRDVVYTITNAHFSILYSYNHIKFVLFIYFFRLFGKNQNSEWEMVKCHGKNWKHGNHVSCHCHTSAAPCTGQTSGSSCFSSTDTRDGCMYIHRKSCVNETLTKQNKKQRTQSAETRLLHTQKTIILLQDTMTSSHETSKIRLTAW